MSEPTLRDAASAIEVEYPGVDVHAVVGDFERHLDRLPGGGTRLVAFLGSTIGNLDPDGRARFYRSIAAGLAPDDALLLGTDLVKDPRRLEAAYDDSAGVTAAFNRNVLSVLNRELAADFAPERFAHIARWNPAEEWIEMRLRSQGAQTVRVRRARSARSSSPTARRCAPRSAPSSAVSGSRRSWPPPASPLLPGGPTPAATSRSLFRSLPDARNVR